MKKNEVIKHFKTRINAAHALGITSGAITQWKDIIPERAALKLERLTNGELKYDPDLYRV